ncbi:MAG: tetratricopeptide repeat protein [Desulfopila sp.]
MSTAKPQSSKDSLAIYVAIAFIAGFLAGAGFAVYKLEPEETTTADPQQQQGISQQQTQAIANLEEEVEAHPDRSRAWTQLANLYYDTGQYEKAVKAYETSLDINDGNADILTDLGVMYRRTGHPRKAIDAFDKAIAMDPTHEISRLNKGIVLMYDLNETEAALASWEKLLEVNPDARTGNGDSIQKFVDQIKADLAKKNE